MNKTTQKKMNRDYDMTDEQHNVIIKKAIAQLEYVARWTTIKGKNARLHNAIANATDALKVR